MKIKKRIKTSLLVMAIAICMLGGIKMNEQLKIKNVFDEMYYTEIADMKNLTAKGFPGMKQIKNWDRKNPDLNNDIGPITERYKENILKKDESATIGFLFSEKQLLISYAKLLSSKLLYRIDFSYSIKTKELEENISIFDETKEIYTITDSKEIEKYLIEYDISTDYLKEKADAILYETVVKDWTAHYDSRFSVDDLGKVTIEKDAFLK